MDWEEYEGLDADRRSLAIGGLLLKSTTTSFSRDESLKARTQCGSQVHTHLGYVDLMHALASLWWLALSRAGIFFHQLLRQFIC